MSERPMRLDAVGQLVPLDDAEMAQRASDAGAGPSFTPTVTGNQWAFALGNIGLAAAWRAGTAKSKDKDQIRVGLIARDTRLLATDPLLIRVAANANIDKVATDPTWIDVPTVFARALTEPT